MHAHRVEVLNRADDDAIVLSITHHLHLELFPAQDGLLDQHFIGGRSIDAAFDDVDELRFVISNAAAGAAQSE